MKKSVAVKKNTRKLIHNFFKIFIIFMIGLIIINVGLYIGLKINHKNKLKKEQIYLNAPGQYVTVNEHKLHVVVGGEKNSDNVLVFLHSDSVIDDSVALLPLMSQLKDCKYIYIDRSGYGFSESYGASKDIDSIIDETKTALNELSIEGPYTLVALGTAGIQAFYWADKYPDEVKSIIGVNMNYPEQFIDFTTEQYCGFLDYLFVKFVGIGGHRLLSNKIFPTDEYNVYSEEQMNTRKAIAGKYMYTVDMYEEQLHTVDNAKLTYELGIPKNADIYLIYNNPFLKPYADTDEDVQKKLAEINEDEENIDYASIFNDDFREYFGGYSNVMIDEMEGPGRLYLYNPDELADMINVYLKR